MQMGVKLSTKELSKNIRLELKERIEKLENKPKLITILVGDNPASKVYVKNKAKACEEVGIISETVILPETITESELLKVIYTKNEDASVSGILVQLPLPKHIHSDNIISSIDPTKDVDGFHPQNVANLWTNKESTIPCTPKGIMKILDSINVDLSGKHVVVVGRSNIVGQPVAKLCLNKNATVTICHSKTKDLKNITLEGDVLIVAIGKPNFITADMVKMGAVVIDVGINRNDNKIVGDVNFENVEYKCSYITPVPGGVGPMTITCLLENTLELHLKHRI